jgi:uncharacterized protein (TIGR02145 family)
MKTTLLFLCLIILNANCTYTQDVKIGKQVWMSKNLDVSTFRNGDEIAEAKSISELRSFYFKKTPAWCYYNFDPKNANKYGKLYNCFAVDDKRGLAPEGYRIPSSYDFKILITSLSNKKFETYQFDDKVMNLSCETAAKKLQSKTDWKKEWIPYWREWRDRNGNNSSKFNAFPAGHFWICSNCDDDDVEVSFKGLGSETRYWATKFWDKLLGTYIRPSLFLHIYAQVSSTNDEYYFPVRCLKD